MTQQQLTIAQTIFKQLHEAKVDGYLTVGAHMNAWGVKAIKGNDEPDTYGIGGVQFNVDGSKYKGSVKVALQPNNSYTVILGGLDNITTLNRAYQTIERVHYSQLAATIDKIVEG